MARKKILYIQASGPEEPEKQYAPLVLAQTARAMDLDATVFYLGAGIAVLAKDQADTIQMGDFPTVGDLLREAAAQGVRIMACQQSLALFGGRFTPEDLPEGVTIAGAATLNDEALDADSVLTF